MNDIEQKFKELKDKYLTDEEGRMTFTDAGYKLLTEELYKWCIKTYR